MVFIDTLTTLVLCLASNKAVERKEQWNNKGKSKKVKNKSNLYRMNYGSSSRDEF